MTIRKRTGRPRGKQTQPLTPAQAKRPFGGSNGGASAQIDRAKRVADLEDRLAGPYSKGQIIAYAVETYGISQRTIYVDLAEIEERWLAENVLESKERHVRAMRSWQRRQRRCEERGEEQAANFALDRLHKITGEFAAKKIEVSGTMGVEITLQVQSVLGVLDDYGRQCLEIVQQQIAAAREKGLLAGVAEPPTADDDAIDAVAQEVETS